MNFILFDDPAVRVSLLPFTFTRPVADLRVGILTIAEKWEKRLQQPISFSTSAYLEKKFKLQLTTDNVWINGAVCPDEALVKAVLQLKTGEGIFSASRIVAIRTPEDEVPEVISGKVTEWNQSITWIDQTWKIFQQNGAQIRADFGLLTTGRTSIGISDKYTRVYNEGNIFIEEGAKTIAALLNADNGPIYIGKNAVVQEGALIRGPFALGEESFINMGAKIRGDVSVGPHSKVGGEVSTSVLFGNSNKGHDGFLGCSVIGEWCNIGADSNTSNLKNNYDNVKVWSYAQKNYIDSGLMFCGLMLGDHSKCSINTMFNTGTVAGVNANIFGDGFPPSFIPSFSWGGSAGHVTYKLDKAFDVATRVLARRNVPLTEEDKAILQHVYTITEEERNWERK